MRRGVSPQRQGEPEREEFIAEDAEDRREETSQRSSLIASFDCDGSKVGCKEFRGGTLIMVG